VKGYLLLALLSATCAAQADDLKMIAVHFPQNNRTPSTIQFFCTQRYDRAECLKDATVLRQAILPYPVQLLSKWSFVLVPADEWKALVRSQGGDPVSPACSILEQRATLLDSSLFVGSAARNKELLQRFDMIGPALVNLAITHEMGHALCQEKNECRADNYGKELREGKIPVCGTVNKPASAVKSMTPAAVSTSTPQ
jgi:hypothetical protein